MKNILFSLLFVSCLAGAAPLQDRWFYVARNLSKPEHVPEIADIVKTARSVDLNGMLFACGAEGVGGWDAARRARLAAVKKLCDEAGIEIIPIIWSVGYGGWNNAWCAADACTNVPFVARGGRAVFEKGAAPMIANGGFEEAAAKRVPGWKFIDQFGEISFVDTAVKASGAASLRMENFTANKHGHGRACAALTVVPGRRYRVRAKMKTENVAPLGGLRLQVYAAKGTQIAARSARMAATQDWTELVCEFDSGARTDYYVYLGIWGGKEGRFWIDDVSVEELGCPPPVVREGLPFVVRDAKTGRVYREGADYVVPVDTRKTKGQSFDLVSGGAITDGTRLVADYWTPVVVADNQHPCCMSAPALYAHYRTSAAAIKEALNPRKWFLSMDEIRGGGTCPLCRARNLDMAHQLADCLAQQRAIIRAVRPDAEIYVWSDMLDPAHNAHDNYYAFRGTFAGVWDLIPKDLIISCWYGEKRDISMPFFSAKGFRTQAAAYYDTDDLGNCPGWLETCRRTPGCTGIMYTTWRNKYKMLAPFGELLKNDK